MEYKNLQISFYTLDQQPLDFGGQGIGRNTFSFDASQLERILIGGNYATLVTGTSGTIGLPKDEFFHETYLDILKDSTGLTISSPQITLVNILSPSPLSGFRSYVKIPGREYRKVEYILGKKTGGGIKAVVELNDSLILP